MTPLAMVPVGLLLLLAAACGGTSPPGNYEKTECQFQLPEGQTVECGYLTVPEDRRQPGGPTIRLHVAVFKSRSEDPAPDPIVYLEGGPGVNGLELARYNFNVFFSPFLAKRDFIMFDQRGTGFSEPALGCPEFVESVYDTLDRNLSAEEAAALSTKTILACRDRLVREGVNLEAYTSAENAADLNDLRVALGYDEWNLYGISYGTKLALTAMRDFLEGIRSAILDSSYPLQVDAYTSSLSVADRAFRVFFDGCATDPACGAAYPDLEGTFFQLVEELNEDPATLSLSHLLTGEDFDALLNGDGLIGFLFQALYSTQTIRFLPQIISDARNDRLDQLAFLLGSFLINVDFVSTGMKYSVQCGEEVQFTTQEEFEDAASAYPRLRGFFDRDPIFAVCRAWGAKKADPIENQAVSSNIPAMVLAGEYDPVTPPDWGRLAAGGLSRSFSFEFPGFGHGVSVSGGCPLSITLAFLDDPATQPDSSCIAGIKGPAFSGADGD